MDYQTTNEAPRGSVWLADAASFYAKKLSEFWETISAPPIVAPENCRTVEELRDYAHRIKHKNPGFASDLLAAIDRSETLNS